MKVVKGVMHVTHKLRETKCYQVKNRAPQDRDLIIEHPVRDDWKLVTPEKANEVSRDVVPLRPAGGRRQDGQAGRGRGAEPPDGRGA